MSRSARLKNALYAFRTSTYGYSCADRVDIERVRVRREQSVERGVRQAAPEPVANVRCEITQFTSLPFFTNELFAMHSFKK